MQDRALYCTLTYVSVAPRPSPSTLNEPLRLRPTIQGCSLIGRGLQGAGGVDGAAEVGVYEGEMGLCPKRVGSFGSSTRFQMRKVVGN